ncbi:hypothetical protein [Jannaschia pohangensis]|nr:hypothetical protein [Jannaschia pohangensis]
MALVGDCKDSLLNHISRSCRYGEGDVAANIAVATAIWDWAEEKKATSIAHQFEPYRLPLSTNSFFESGIICVGAKGYGLLLDPRRSSSGLDHGGRDFAFSAMYWKVFGNADYVDLDLAIMKVTDSKKQRRVKLVEFDGQPVFTNEEVLSRIEETQKIWLDVQLERRHAASRGGEAL